MAAWVPLIKTALPYVVQVLSIAIPAFTAKKEDNNAEIIHEQITELQSAATQNAESVKILAAQLKETIEGVDAVIEIAPAIHDMIESGSWDADAFPLLMHLYQIVTKDAEIAFDFNRFFSQLALTPPV